jgi:EmrB/QacA subfamily drug resistance transporter
MSNSSALPISQPKREAAAPKPISTRLTALIVASALFMEQLDSTVLSTALPTMARSFHVDPLHMSVALTAYLLSLAVFIPASGTLADRFGSRTVFRGAIVLFTVGSMLCGQAPNLTFLVVSRLIQGLGGAMMVPVARLVLLRSVPKSELVSAMAWLLIPATIGPIMGPPIGGLIVDYLSWRWIFYINLPVGIIGFFLVTRYIQEVREKKPAPFDVVGFIFSGIALSCLIFGLEMASRGVGSLTFTGLLVGIGIVSAGIYTWHAFRCATPILDFRLLRIPTFGISVAGGTLTRIATGAVPFLLPMMLQLGFGFSAAQSGIVTFASAVGSLAMKAGAQLFLRTFGFRIVLVYIGPIGTVLLGLCAFFRPSWPIAWIYAVLIVGGFFQSLQFMSLNTIAYADVPREKMSVATSFYTTFQQMSLTLGIAFGAGALAVSEAVFHHGSAALIDYSYAFAFVTVISICSPLVCALLDRNAGEELSGRHPKKLQIPHAAAFRK